MSALRCGGHAFESGLGPPCVKFACSLRLVSPDTLDSAHIPNREFEWLFVYLSAAFWLAISSRCTPPTTEVSSDRLQHHRHPCQDKANPIMDGWVFVSFSLRPKIRKKKNYQCACTCPCRCSIYRCSQNPSTFYCYVVTKHKSWSKCGHKSLLYRSDVINKYKHKMESILHTSRNEYNCTDKCSFSTQSFRYTCPN